MLHVQPATPGTAESAARVLAEAFADDPFMAAVIPPGARHRLSRLRDLFAFQIASSGLANTDVAVLDGARVVGVAVWIAPTGGPPLRRHLPAAWRALRAAGLHGVAEIARFEREVRPLRPTETHWHLEDIGSSPRVRGQGLGIGGALLRHRLALIDASALPVFLEATTPASRRLYERHGFRPRGTLRSAGGTTTAMVRPAAHRATP